MKLENVTYSSVSVCDPLGRVFFYKNRIFRAIRDDYKDYVLTFLSSECYKELLLSGQIVETKVREDLELEGYALILEHERLFCDTWKYWSFEQLKDALLFIIDLNDKLKESGYFLKDAGFQNIAIKDNHFCLMDFGSVGGGNHVNLFEEQIARSFLHLNLLSQKQYFLADTLPYYHSNHMPFQDKITMHDYYKYIKPIVRKIDIYYRYRYRPITFRLIAVVRLIEWIMSLLNIDDKKQTLVFHHIKFVYNEKIIRKRVSKLHSPYRAKDNNYFKVEVNPHGLIVNKKGGFDRNVLLYGNYSYEFIEDICHRSPSQTIIVGSIDRIYIGRLYQYAKVHNLNVQALLLDIYNLDGKEMQQFHANKLIMGSQILNSMSKSMGVTKDILQEKLNSQFAQIIYTGDD